MGFRSTFNTLDRCLALNATLIGSFVGASGFERSRRSMSVHQVATIYIARNVDDVHGVDEVKFAADPKELIGFFGECENARIMDRVLSGCCASAT